MLVSIIVPVYNGEEYIQRCLDSLLGQTYQNIEILVIDDGSKDRTVSILKDYAKKDKVTIVTKENGGVSSARNKGLSLAKGDFVTFCDCDDYMDPTFIEVLLKEQAEKDFDVVETPGLFELLKKGKVLTYTERPLPKEKYISMTFLEEFHKNSLRYVNGILYRRSLLENIFFDEEIRCYEDSLFNLQLRLRVKRYCFLPVCLYHYVQRENSLSTSWNDKHFDYFLVIEKAKEYYKKEGFEKFIPFLDEIFGGNILVFVFLKLPNFSLPIQEKMFYLKKYYEVLKKTTYFQKHPKSEHLFKHKRILYLYFCIMKKFPFLKVIRFVQSQNRYKPE